MRISIISLVLLSGLFSGAILGADDVKLADNPPDRYTVVKGDTLWGIAGKFLKEPWRWPEVWRMNQSEIKNPHLIYPGDVVVLDNTGGSPRLTLLKDTPYSQGTLKLKPQVRVESLDAKAIPSIPASAIEPFLSKPLVIEESGLDKSPRIVAGPEERVILTAGDYAYALGVNDDNEELWQIFRPGKKLVDPDSPDGKAVLGYEAEYLGEVRLEKQADISKLLVLKTTAEVNIGDKLLPAPKQEFISYSPHAPQTPIKGRIVSAYGGVAEASQYTIVVINKGRLDGLEPGHVLAMYAKGRPIKDLKSEEGPRVTPSERSGLMFVFRVFGKVSYALIMQTTGAIHVGDEVTNP